MLLFTGALHVHSTASSGLFRTIAMSSGSIQDFFLSVIFRSRDGILPDAGSLWNILLDETGGPNHVGNLCFAPLHANTKTGELYYLNSFYYIGHFSKFIRPGAKRIISS